MPSFDHVFGSMSTSGTASSAGGVPPGGPYMFRERNVETDPLDRIFQPLLAHYHQLVAAGTKLHRFPKDVMDASFKASNEIYAEISAKNATWKKVYDDYIAFRRDQNLWFRFAEASFDDFMQSQKL